jgi:hypothetical protein
MDPDGELAPGTAARLGHYLRKPRSGKFADIVLLDEKTLKAQTNFLPLTGF